MLVAWLVRLLKKVGDGFCVSEKMGLLVGWFGDGGRIRGMGSAHCVCMFMPSRLQRERRGWVSNQTLILSLSSLPLCCAFTVVIYLSSAVTPVSTSRAMHVRQASLSIFIFTTCMC